MKYQEKVEYLCRLFVGSFKKSNRITPQDVVEIVKKMQIILQGIHKKNIQVVDYHEMNILVDTVTLEPYHIDVDSYQTPRFNATAILDSVCDYQAPPGVFTELTDWFSWGIVTFHLYTGIHPFKGRHPSYKPGELLTRMRNGVSVFDRDVRLPKSCRDFSVIPQAHLEWYKKVFADGERCIPPLPGTILFSGSSQRSTGTGSGDLQLPGNFTVALLQAYPSPISGVVSWNGRNYVITADGVYRKEHRLISIKDRKTQLLLAGVATQSHGGRAGGSGKSFEEPAVAVKDGDMVTFFDIGGDAGGRISARDMMACNNHIYTLGNGYLVENRFEKMGKVKHLPTPVASVPGSAVKLFNGVGIVDLFGRKKLLLPIGTGKCVTVEVAELEAYRVVEALREKNYVLLVGEKNGEFHRIILHFNDRFNTYNTRIDSPIDVRDIHFIVKSDGLALLVKDNDMLEMFYDLSGPSKEISFALGSSCKLFDGGGKTLCADGNKLYSVTNSV
ncbi:MAG: hypothetical protein GY765_41065 [bacterium]|nr:hypothetical protein [bacterium]